MNQAPLFWPRQLVVDLFAGGAGASTGLAQAIGRHVDIAVNHDPEAMMVHRANHPEIMHYGGDVFDIDPRKVVRGQRVDPMGVPIVHDALESSYQRGPARPAVTHGRRCRRAVGTRSAAALHFS